MRTVFLHGFATTPQIWPRGGPQIRFEDIDGEAKKLAMGLGEEAGLVGWSMGGMVAIKIAAMFPEKIKELVLVSTTPKFIKSKDFPFGLPLALLRRLEKKIMVEGVSAFHDLVFKNGHKLGLAHLPVEEALKELAELGKVDLRDALSKIQAPTLIVHGDQDEICLPGAARYMKERISNSRLIMLEGVGHAPMVEVPERLKEIIEKHAG